MSELLSSRQRRNKAKATKKKTIHTQNNQIKENNNDNNMKKENVTIWNCTSYRHPVYGTKLKILAQHFFRHFFQMCMWMLFFFICCPLNNRKLNTTIHHLTWESEMRKRKTRKTNLTMKRQDGKKTNIKSKDKWLVSF